MSDRSMGQFVLLTTVLAVSCVVSGHPPRSLHGRPRGGMLGSPGFDHLTEDDLVLALSQVPGDQWFTQKLDHFDQSNMRQWQQRYFTSGDLSDGKKDTLFVMIGGEGNADPIWNVMGAWIDYAKTYKAICLQLEHRYYGNSHPTPDTGVANLRFLSTQQALADLAVFISAKKREYSARKVIVFGGSYAGSLAAWFRLKYPHLANGAVASSAPLLAQVNFVGYLEVVRDSLNRFKPPGACNSAVSSATSAIKDKLQTREGRSQLKQLFRLCDDIDVNLTKDVSNLFAILAENFMGVVQYNRDNRAFKGTKGTNITIGTICGIMTDTSVGSELERYAQVNNLLLDTYEESCTDFIYQEMIDSLREEAWASAAAEGGRQWTYQTCTEYGFYQSSDSREQPFGHAFPMGFWTHQCAEIFGRKFNATFIHAGVHNTNIEYGARHFTQDHVVFVNGAIDPWHYLGITTSLPQSPVIFIPGTAHCADLYPPTSIDPPGLVQARADISDMIGRWLQG